MSTAAPYSEYRSIFLATLTNLSNLAVLSNPINVVVSSVSEPNRSKSKGMAATKSVKKKKDFSMKALVSYVGRLKNVTYDKPTAEVVDSNFGRRADHFVILTDISRSEIDENVNDEHDIDCKKRLQIQLE